MDTLQSNQQGIWKTVGDAVQTKEFKAHFLKRGKATFSDAGKTDDRINPNYSALKDYFAKRSMSALCSDESARVGVGRMRVALQVCGTFVANRR
jgi:hypothetical protein